jgi:hypothetical protein
MLSIGTAGTDPIRLAHQADKSGLKWASELAIYMIGVQERSAALQARRLLGPNRYLRIDHSATPGIPAFENLDLADDESRRLLLAAAARTAESAYQKNQAFVDRLLAPRP